MPTLALLTDFGQRDGFVGVMKGVLYSIFINPAELSIIDLSHEIPAQDIRAASWILENSFPYFPRNTIFLCVVDPHVGHPDQKKLLLHWPDRELFFIGPDNGLFTPILTEAGNQLECFAIQNGIYHLDERYKEDALGNTFQGRDLYAPVAAHLANAIHDNHIYPFIQSLASPLENPVRQQGSLPVLAENSATGVIDYIDIYGNLITNIPNLWLVKLSEKDPSPIVLNVQLGNHAWSAPVVTSYSEGQTSGEVPFAIAGSHGQIEIAVFSQSAQKALHPTIGDKIVFSHISHVCR